MTPESIASQIIITIITVVALLITYHSGYVARQRDNKEIWRPIRTAPKNGTIILAKVADTKAIFNVPETPMHVWWAIAGYWDNDRECWTDGMEKLVPPTHWMPMPEIPDEQ